MTPDKDIFSTKQGRWDFAIAIAVIALFSIFIYMYMFNNENEITEATPDLETTEKGQLPTSYHSEDREYVYTNSETYVPVTIPAKDAIDPNKKIAIIISDTTLTEADLVDDKIDSVVKQEIVDKPENTLSTESVKSMVDTVTTGVESKEIKEPVVEKEDVLTESSKTASVANTTSELNCMAMVGVFKDQNNIAAIIKKLNALGYTHAQGAYPKGLTYISVPVDCEDESKKKQLISELNKAFGIDSWVKRR
ncbi:SPOR domain-containing protein [Maribacter forsetii]|uniref:SPOR domain-containing protein n=1 Tax=Maribacter forsetii TaxID=444515 RepID=UPI00056561B3|nr:SPOR domain-containing protein [Maribacter forsetii]